MFLSEFFATLTPILILSSVSVFFFVVVSTVSQTGRNLLDRDHGVEKTFGCHMVFIVRATRTAMRQSRMSQMGCRMTYNL
jgi:hypothetical protein